MTKEQMLAEIAKLQAENGKLRDRAKSKVRLCVSVKGGVSVYGVRQRFPITLYPEQMKTLLSMKDEILAFIEANEAELRYKAQDKKTVAQIMDAESKKIAALLNADYAEVKKAS